ncbi:putative endopeptidase [Microbacteriaceae bacterium MWH-Ta3]|nr:putative endopeptidase [Microbacteriaceae bacterium MWH-Ta3]
MTKSGIEIDERHPTIRPADDLYRHMNELWIERTPIPADKARYGSFHKLAEDSEKAVHAIIQECQTAPHGTEARKVGDMFTSFMDEAAINARGSQPIRPFLAEIDAAGSVAELLAVMGRNERAGTSGFIQLFIDNDPGNPERYVVFTEQDGLGLPDESYYREDTFATVREAYKAHLATMFELAELDDCAGRAQRVFDFETALATHHWYSVRCRDSVATYNLQAWSDVLALTGDVLDEWRVGMGIPAEALADVVVRQPSFLEGLGELLRTTDLQTLADWSRWAVIHAHAAYLSAPFSEANFAFYGTILSGTPEQRARWKRGVSLVEGSLGHAIGKIYVERHYPESAKAAMDDLIANLIEAYRESITQLDWMTDDTKAKALEKLDKFTPKIGYPATWRDYSTIEIRHDDLIHNVRQTTEYEFARELGKIGSPLDRDEWFMLPQTVNAYYNPGFNEIVFPAAILQYPFFVEDRDPAANYGAIGAVIGHEIGHGFDDQGSTFDGDGRLENWWTEADLTAFKERTGALIDQYNALEPRALPGHHVNGELTIGENIGDLGGLAIAWKAYVRSLDGAEAPVVEGLTGAQRVLLSWAQAWRQSSRDEEALRLLSIDPHSPPEFRCNQIVRNLDFFYEAFDVTESDPMWLAPEQRVSIW